MAADQPGNGVSERAATASSPETVLVRTLDAYRARLTHRALRTRVLVALTPFVLLPLLVVVADHFWSGGLPGFVLHGALLLWAVGVGGGLLATVILTLARHLNPAFVAQQLERGYQIPHNTVVNAVLLRSATGRAYAVDALVRQAVRDLTKHEPAKTPEMRSSRVPVLVLLAAAAAWVLYTGATPKPVGPSLARFFGADRAAPTATWLELIHPTLDEAVHAGEALTIEMAVHGRPVSEVRLDILSPAGDARTAKREYVSAAAGRDTDEHHRFTLPPVEVRDDIRYRCLAGDARLEGVLAVHPQPDIERIEVTLEPPAYTGEPATVTNDVDLSILAGTRATFRVRANTPISEPVFVFDGGRQTRTRMSTSPEEPQQATVTLVPVESGTYRVSFSDPWQAPYRDPPPHHVDVHADAPPTVQIVAPSQADTPDDVVDVARFPEFVGVAEDDVKVVALLFYVEQGGATSRGLASAAAAKHVVGRINVAALPRAEGVETARAWFEVQDGRVLPDGREAPQTARSRVVTLVWPAVGDDSAANAEPGSVSSQPAGKDEQAGGQSTPAPTVARRADRSPPSEQPDQAADGTQTPASAPSSQPADRERSNEGARPENTRDSEAEGEPQEESTARETDRAQQQADEQLEQELEQFARAHGAEAEQVVERLREAETGPPEGQGTESAAGDTAKPSSDGQGQENGQQQGGEPGKADSPKPGEPSGQPQESPGGSETPPGSTDRPTGETGQQDGSSGPGNDTPGGTDPKQGAPPGQSQSPSEAQSGQNTAQQPGAQTGPQPGAETPGEGQPGVGSGGAQPGQSRRRAATVELLERVAQGAAITEELLTENGGAPERASAFVQAVRRLHELARDAGEAGQLRRLVFDTRVGDRARTTGRGLADDVQREVAAGERPQDGLRRIAPPPEQQVPDELRPVLEAYYRSLAAHRE